MTINASGPHPSHELRSGDASTWDVKCINCGYTDHVPGGWGELASPCRKAKPVSAMLDDIAKEAAVVWMNECGAFSPVRFGGYVIPLFSRAALDKAIEAVLTAEPSEEALEATVEAYTGYQSPVDRGYAQQEEGMRLAHRAMSAALLEEIKK